MLRLITGRAGSGKTAAIYNEIRQAAEKGQGRRLLIVPEQYSHEAERELCRTCGDTLSLYAEVLSFTGLARKVSSEVGGIARQLLDKGGRMLCMAQAIKQVSGQLTAFQRSSGQPEVQKMLLDALDGIKASCVSPEALLSAAQSCGGRLGEKLRDLAMISEAYDAVLGSSWADPSDRLSVLAEQLPQWPFLTEESAVFVDGFTDFTNAELSVLRAILASGTKLTVCLTIDARDSRNEVFSLPNSSAGKLMEAAKELAVEVQTVTVGGEELSEDPIRLFADELFSYTDRQFPHEGKIRLFSCSTMQAECEQAAAEILTLVREGGSRWQDIAVAVRGFEDYAAVLENTMEEYAIPLFSARRAPLAAKPLPALISSAYSVVLGGWNVDDVIAYMDTGLTGLSREECDILSAYIDFWNPDEAAWQTDREWRQHPEGYGKEYTEETNALLSTVNRLKLALSAPLLKLQQRAAATTNAAGQAAALAAFLEELSLAKTLDEKAEHLREGGKTQQAEEYQQLWELIVSALEQTAAILADAEMNAEEFSGLFLLTLSQYDVGVIPASLDAVTAGDFDRMRRRNIRHLFVLGADDARLPSSERSRSIFSEDELLALSTTEAAIGENPEKELWREYMLIYNCLSLPSESLTILYTSVDDEGNEARPSFVMERAKALFALQMQHADEGMAALSAPRPAFRLAASGEGAAGLAAKEYFVHAAPEKMQAVTAAAAKLRGSLSHQAAEALYGRKIRVSASQAEKFYSCKYAYFFQYGLKAKTHKKAEFSAAEMGSFTHFVLQRTAEDIRKLGGFSAVDDETVAQTARKHIAAYETDVLQNFKEKTERFRYLFQRAEEDVVRIALDMAQELRFSGFTPLAFELNFSNGEVFPQILLNKGGDVFRLSGIADRVDGLEQEGKIYLRVIDYKTGKKEFSLSDIWYGMGMQLLLYLYALQADPKATAAALDLPRESEIISAGAVYAPARNPILNLDGDETAEEVCKKRSRELKRSGIMMEAADIPQLWDKSPEQIYSPLKKDRKGNPTRDSLLTAEEFSQLYRHMKQRLSEMTAGLRQGSIEADPYKTDQLSACTYCDYAGRCGFADGENGERYRLLSKLSNDTAWENIAKEAEADA